MSISRRKVNKKYEITNSGWLTPKMHVKANVEYFRSQYSQ